MNSELEKARAVIAELERQEVSTAPELRVHVEISRLLAKIDMVADLVGHLVARLEPVLAPGVVGAECPDGGAEEESICLVASQIRDGRRRLETNIGTLREMLDALAV